VGISAARNCGLFAASGDIVAFTDDDAEVDPGWLRAYVRRFVDDRSLACTTGLVIPRRLDTMAQHWFEAYYGGFARGFEPVVFRSAYPSRRSRRHARPRSYTVNTIDIDGNVLKSDPLHVAAGHLGVGANMAFPREVLLQLGGFDEALGAGTRTRGGEEIAAFATILWNGGKIAYEPTALVYHTHRSSYDELLHQVAGCGVSITASITALAISDPTLALALLIKSGMARAVGRWITSFVSGKSLTDHITSQGMVAYPPALRRAEVRGLLQGPLAYFRSLLERNGAAISDDARAA
jgi:hypothetical protein